MPIFLFHTQNKMKIKTAVKKICAECKIVKRKRHLRVICSNPKHKQKQ